MIDVEEVDKILSSQALKIKRTTLDLENSLGHVLAQSLSASRDFPPFDRVTHDGIALNSKHYQSNRSYRSEGYAAAGQERFCLQSPQNCVEVATGAPLPEGTDTVVPYEMLLEKSERHFETKSERSQPYQFVHRQGVDCNKGQELLPKGKVIGIPELGILASNGYANVEVFAPPRIAIVTTGDELIQPGKSIEYHQIYRSNDIVLQSLLKDQMQGIRIQTVHLLDDLDSTLKALTSLLEENDILLTVGGVSKGKRDFLPQAFNSLGTEKLFHGVAQRPGKPMWVGQVSNKYIFGLPGNPVSAFSCTCRYVLPFLKTSMGLSPDYNSSLHAMRKPKTLARDISFKPSLTFFASVALEGENAVVPVSHNGSGDFMSLAQADGFLELPRGQDVYEKGQVFPFFPFRGVS